MSKSNSWCFPQETIKFLTDLRANNNRDWFAANKPVYEHALKNPAVAFCNLMVPELDALSGQQHSSKVFRIFRDVRFSKDKTPYKAHIHISFYRENTQPGPPGWFFGLDPDRLVIGAGIFAFDKADLETYRDRVAGPDGTKLAALLGRLTKKGIRMEDPELKRVPRGFDADHRHADLLRRKGLTLWWELGNAKLASKPTLVADCRSAFRTLKPLVDWLAAEKAQNV